MDGISFWQQALGAPGEPRQVIYTWYNANNKATDQSKLMRYAFNKHFKRYAPHANFPEGRFFDLRTDRLEQAGDVGGGRATRAVEEGTDDHDDGRDEQEDRRVGEEGDEAREGARRPEAAERPASAGQGRTISQRPQSSWRPGRPSRRRCRPGSG